MSTSTAGTTFHMALDIRNFMKTSTLDDYRNMLKGPDGKALSPEKAQDAMLDLIAKGHNFLSFGGCDNFDPIKEGCIGHPPMACEEVAA